MNSAFIVEQWYVNDKPIAPSQTPTQRNLQLSRELSEAFSKYHGDYLEKKDLQRVNFDITVEGDFLVINKFYLVWKNCNVTVIEEKHKIPIDGHTSNKEEVRKGGLVKMPDTINIKKGGSLLILAIGLIIAICMFNNRLFSTLGGTLLIVLSLFASYHIWMDAKEDESRVQ